MAGIAGWLLVAVLAVPIRHMVFEDAVPAWTIAAFGITLLLSMVSSQYLSDLQAQRKIALLAKVGIVTSAISTAVAIASYWIWRRDGILIALIGAGIVQLVVAWVVARKRGGDADGAQPATREQRWRDTVRIGRRLSKVGAASLAGALSPAILTLVLGTIITQTLGVEANGLYWAAWGLSGLLASFIMSAMGADYFPRISACSNDRPMARQLVNEQIEAGLLLGTPGLVGTIVLSPLALYVFYSTAFIEASGLVVFFCCGIMVQLASWPVGLLILAQERSLTFILLQVLAVAVRTGLSLLGARLCGLQGLAAAFLLSNLVMMSISRVFVYRTLEFSWTPAAWRLIVMCTGFCSLAALSTLLEPALAGPTGLLMIALAFAMSLRGLAGRLTDRHRIVRLAHSTPLIRTLIWLCRTPRSPT
jgi:PST family polysaccharide transporter